MMNNYITGTQLRSLMLPPGASAPKADRSCGPAHHWSVLVPPSLGCEPYG